MNTRRMTALPIDPPALTQPPAGSLPAPGPLRPGPSPVPFERDWWRRVEWTPAFIGFLIYIFVVVTYRLGIGSAAVGLALLGTVFQKARFRFPPFLVLLFGSFVWATFGGLQSVYGPVVNEALIDRFKVCLVAMVAVNALRTGRQVRFFMTFLLVSYMLFPIRSVLVNYLRGYTEFGRAVGPAIYANSNDLAALALLALAVALAVVSLERRPGPVRWGAMASVVALIVTILLTKSRGGFLAMAVMLGPTTLGLVRRKPRTLIPIAVLVTLVAVLTPASTWDRFLALKLTTRAEEINRFDTEGSAKERFEILRTAVRITSDHPVFGIGLGAYPLANRDYSPRIGFMDTHNTYLNLAAEVGIPGLLLFLVLVWTVLRRSRRIRRQLRGSSPDLAQAQRWLEMGLVSYLTAGIFGSFSKLAFPYVFMALIWAHAETLRKLLQPNPAGVARGRS